MIDILVASGTGMLFMCIGVQLYTAIKTSNQIKELKEENKELRDSISRLNQSIESIAKRVDRDLERGEQRLDSKFNEAAYNLKRFQEEIVGRVKFLARKSSQDY